MDSLRKLSQRLLRKHKMAQSLQDPLPGHVPDSQRPAKDFVPLGKKSPTDIFAHPESHGKEIAEDMLDYAKTHPRDDSPEELQSHSPQYSSATLPTDKPKPNAYLESLKAKAEQLLGNVKSSGQFLFDFMHDMKDDKPSFKQGVEELFSALGDFHIFLYDNEQKIYAKPIAQSASNLCYLWRNISTFVNAKGWQGQIPDYQLQSIEDFERVIKPYC